MKEAVFGGRVDRPKGVSRWSQASPGKIDPPRNPGREGEYDLLARTMQSTLQTRRPSVKEIMAKAKKQETKN